LRITPDDDEGAGSTLHFLGRRLERLFFGGLFIILLCLVELSFASAHKQLAEDHSAAGVTLLLERLKGSQETLENLYNAKRADRKVAPTAAPPTNRREQEVAATRMFLGLPPPAPRSSRNPEQEPVPKQETYAEVLSKIISNVSADAEAPRSELEQFELATVAPAEIVRRVESRKNEIESSSTSIWGIQTPRVFRLRYAEQEYNIPYGTLSIVFMIPLGVLIVGWFAAVYMTRQRELILISRLDDYKMAFPHILNFLPVDFVSLYPHLKERSQKQTRQHAAVTRVVQFLVRSCVALLLAVPMIAGFAYASILVWGTEGEPTSFLFVCVSILAFVMAMQIIVLVVQEWVVLRGKHFTS
jgi:hypothetical protein